MQPRTWSIALSASPVMLLRRRKARSDGWRQPLPLPEEVLPSVRAALGGKDAVTPATAAAKRKAEEEPDDPRAGVFQNIGYDDDAPISGGAETSASGGGEASGSGTKRPADEEADDRDRGDDAGGGGSNDDDDGMIGAVLPFNASTAANASLART